jgi:hypothetical protein
MSVARVSFKGQTIEVAVNETLSNGRHCRNPEAISDKQLHRLHKAVSKAIKTINQKIG